MERSARLTIAHRGASAHAPENTLAAARLAHALGADMWETDVQMTRDGVPVLLHDATLERTSDVAAHPEFADRAPWRTDSFTLDEIRTLDAGSWFGTNDPFGTVASGELTEKELAPFIGETIPTLEEGLALTRKLGWRVNIELKNLAGSAGHETITRAVMDMIRKQAMEQSVCLSSFQSDYLREAASLSRSVPRGLLVEKGVPEKAQGLQHCGLCAGIYETLTVEEAIRLCRDAEADFFHPSTAFLSADFVAALHDAGFPVNAWVIDEVKDARTLLDWSVFGFITNYPGRLRKTLGPCAG
ncbi:glycerophosphodiester phosphodiesterase [Desulfovibrio sp. OttesenSCG-928-G15]|nr:glycerophosphodiester phosphodiesterase [Desulfovibrio sp. OttesenSCG-928-G15]